MERNIYPDAKEMSEAETMRHAAVTKLDMRPGVPSTLAVVVGDGKHPRVGSLLAMTSSWQIISIDPACVRTESELRIDRLTIIKERVGEVDHLEIPDNIDRVILLSPHSHAKLQDGYDLIARSINVDDLVVFHAAAMPCCERQHLEGRLCDARYRDLGCWSSKGSIQLWRHLQHPERRTQQEEPSQEKL